MALIVHQTDPQFLVLFDLFCGIWVPLLHAFGFADLLLLCCGKKEVLRSLCSFTVTPKHQG